MMMITGNIYMILLAVGCCCCLRLEEVVGFSFLQSPYTSIDTDKVGCNHRRQILIEGGTTTTTIAGLIFGLTVQPLPALARAPGSKDLQASIQQIVDASKDLKQLEKDWNQYATIDAEGRAGSTDGARRILGGIAPQAGSVAIDVASKTPLYRIDVAFVTIRKAVLESDDSNNNNKWTNTLDLDRFEELVDRINYEIQKADGNFYSVLFAAKGTKMIEDIFKETKNLVKQGIKDLDEMISLLQNAGAPGLS